MDGASRRKSFQKAGFVETGKRNGRLETCYELQEPPESPANTQSSVCERHARRGDTESLTTTDTSELRRKMFLSVQDNKTRGSISKAAVKRREHTSSCDRRERGKDGKFAKGENRKKGFDSAKSRISFCSDFSETEELEYAEPHLLLDRESNWSSDEEIEILFESQPADDNVFLDAAGSEDNENIEERFFGKRKDSNESKKPKVVKIERQDSIEEPTVQVYRRACRLLRLIPSKHLLADLSKSKMTLKYQVLGIKGTKACAIALVNNTTVQKLDLTGNDMRDLGAEYIAESLSANLYITHLTLADNNISSVGLKCLVEVLRDSQMIRHLSIADNKFHETDAESIASLLMNNASLTSLDLSHNCFADIGGQIIGPAIGENNTLQYINLSWNAIRRKGAIALIEGLRVNQSLKAADLGWNGLALEGSVALCNCLGENQELVYLDISSNRIDNESLLFILRGLKKNSVLKYLKMAFNPISTEGATILMETIRQTDSIALREVDITGQSVEEKFVECLEKAKDKRPHLLVAYGVVLRQKDKAMDADGDFLNEDPMMVLMEFMRQKNMRLVDLFQKLDTDGSKSVSYDEFRDGLLSVNIPMSAAAVNKLLEYLDKDGDGEVDFAELMEGQKEYRRKLTLIQAKERQSGLGALNLDSHESELSRISRKVQQLLKVKEAMRSSNQDVSQVPNTAEEQALRKMGKKVLAMNRDKRRQSSLLRENVMEALKGLNVSDKKLSRLQETTTEKFTNIRDILSPGMIE